MLQTGPMRIFVVDDEAIIVDTLTMILRRNGFDAHGFGDPCQAIVAALRQAPHLLISDVMMPALSGIDLAIQIRTAHPFCEILLFSGQANTSDLLQNARQKGHDFKLLAKPVHPLEVLKQVRGADAQWQLGAANRSSPA